MRIFKEIEQDDDKQNGFHDTIFVWYLIFLLLTHFVNQLIASSLLWKAWEGSENPKL